MGAPANQNLIKRELLLLVQTFREAQQDHAKDLSAAIAFWAFFSIFPLLIGILSLAGYFLNSTELQTRIMEVVTEMFPGSSTLVKDNLDAVVQYRGTMSFLGIGGLLWTASKGFGAITRAVNQAIGAKRTQNFLLAKIRHFSMAAAVSLLAIASIGLTIVLEFVLDAPFLERLGISGYELPRLRSWIVSFAMILLVFALIYKLAPYVETRWRQILPGALLAAALFELVKTAFVMYLDKVAHFQAVYGSLSSIIILLLWLYISALILFFGAEYNIVRMRSATADDAKPAGESSR